MVELELSSLLLMCEHRLRILERGDDGPRHCAWCTRKPVRPAVTHWHDSIC